MLKRPLFFVFLLIAFIGNAQDLKQIRSQYPLANTSEEITSKLEDQLLKLAETNQPALFAYQGAVKTLKAHFSKRKAEKKEYFKEGVSLIESAMAADPGNIEIHYIRLSVQENAPKYLGYHKDIESDREFILKNYAQTTSPELKSVIKKFISKSKNFDHADKQMIGV